MSVLVDGALFAGGFGQEEGAPVGDAAHDAARREHDVAGRFGDFFDLGDATVGADLKDGLAPWIARGGVRCW